MREDPVSSTAGNVVPDLPEQDDGSVGTLELFFDLVFVYTMSQVTSLMSADISWLGFGCSSPRSRCPGHSGNMPDLRAGLSLRPTAARCAVRAPRPRQRRAKSSAGETDPHAGHWAGVGDGRGFYRFPVSELLWLVGGLIDFSGPIISRMQGWKVLPSYFVERHGNIMIIALGESIVQVGVGAHGDATRPSLLVGVALGVLISAGLWWAYFGSIRPHAHGSCNAPEVCYKASWPVTPTATFTCRSSAASCTSLSESTRRLPALTSRSLC